MNESVRIRPWPDPVIDTLGHDPRAPYPERFWLPTLGPTALLLLRHIAYRFDREPEGFTLGLGEASRCLGLGERDGRNSPMARSLSRLVQFDLAVTVDGQGSALSVRRLVPPINRRHVRRLPPTLQAEHEAWAGTQLAQPPVAAARRNARRIALLLLGSGDDRAQVEHALGSTGFAPALARDATLWAWAELERADPVPLRNIAAPA